MKLLWSICLSLVFSLSLTATSFAQDTIRGYHEAVGKVPAKNSLEQVQFEEFMNFGCPHCNNFRLQTEEMRKKYEGRVNFVDVPILFQGQDDAPLRLYYVAKRLGKAEEAKAALFEARFKHDVNVFDPGIVNYLSRSLGIGSEYQAQHKADWVNQAIQMGSQRAQHFGIRSTPTVVLHSALKMNPRHSMDQFVRDVDHALEDLLKPASSKASE